MAASVKAKYFLSTSAIALASLVAIPAAANAEGGHAWVLDQVGGSFSTDITQPNITNITQHSDRAIGVGNLDIQSYQTVNIQQNNSGSLFVAKDNRNDPTQILGKLSSNGRVMVLDENGIFFGANAVLDVGGIIASTGDLDNAAVLRGDTSLELGNFGDASIINNGTVSVSGAGLAAFVAPHVVNNGIISAKLGKVVLASGGERATVDLYGDGLVELAVDGAKGKALIENTGNIEAGNVLITANAAKDMVDTVINMKGVVKATTFEQKGGKIVLKGGSAGKVKVDAILNASGENGGGEISVTGENIEVSADTFVLADAIANGNGGQVYVYGFDNTAFSGNIYARGGQYSGNGGAVEVSAKNQLGYDGTVSTMAANGLAGSFLLDPSFAVIHSGLLHNLLGLEYVLSARSLANDLHRNGSVTVQADNYINVGTDFPLLGNGDIDMSQYNYTQLEITGYIWGFPVFGLVNYAGTTSGLLTLDSNIVNFNKNLYLGTGDLNVLADTINLNARLYDLDGALDQADITSTATQVNVLTNNALIQQGVYLAASGGTVNVAAGAFTEQVEIGKDLNLVGAGIDQTYLYSPTNLAQTGTSPNGAKNYAVIYAHDAADVNISGFTVDGSTNAQTVPFNDTNRFIGILYRNAGGEIRENQIQGIKSADTSKRSGFGILASDDAGAESTLDIVDNVIWDFQKYGIALANSKLNATLRNNVIIGDKNNIATEQVGVLVTDGAKVTVGGDDPLDGNQIESTDIGVQINGAGNNVVKGNTIYNIHKGVVVSSSPNTKIEGNGIYGNSEVGIDISASNGSTVYSNHVGNFNTGIKVASSNNVTVSWNYIFDILNGYAVDFNGGTTSKINNNFIGIDPNAPLVANNIKGDGIHAVNLGAGSEIKDNEITETTGDAIHLEGGSSVKISGNDIDNVDRRGVYVNQANAFEIHDNDINNASWSGIQVEGGSKGTITENTLYDVRGNGIQVSGTNKVDVKDNDVSKIRLSGIVTNDTIDATVENNVVHTTGSHGIEASHNVRLKLLNNFIGFTDDIGTAGTDGNIRGDGIYASASHGVVVQGNDVTKTFSTEADKGSGIHVLNSNGAVIGGANDVTERNIVRDIAWDGIKITGGDTVTVENNLVDDVDRVGIYAGGAHNKVTIKDNVLTNGNKTLGDYGAISTDGGSNITVTGNDIDGSVGYGVRLNGGGGVNTVSFNLVDDVDRDGIRVDGATGLTISRNEIGQSGANAIGGHGVSVFNAGEGATLLRNDIDNVGGDGIHVLNTEAALIRANNIGLNGDAGSIKGDGVHVADVSSTWVLVNNISNASGDGVDVSGQKGDPSYGDDWVYYPAGPSGLPYASPNDVFVSKNYIDTVDGNGIAVQHDGKIWVHDNDVIDAGLNGMTIVGDIGAGYGDNLLVNQNRVRRSTLDGISATGFTAVDVHGNLVRRSGQSGIVVTAFDDADIYENRIRYAGADGIHVDGQNATATAWVTDNNIRYADDDGIEIANLGAGRVLDNVVRGSGDDGIYAHGIGSIGEGGEGEELPPQQEAFARVALAAIDPDPYAESLVIANNTVRRSGGDGVEVGEVSTALIDNNRILRSSANGILASGALNGDIALVGNTLTNNTVGARFESGLINLTGDANTITGGDIGLQFDAVGELNLLDDTIGTTVFDDQATYYVELLNGALFAPGTPTIINGLNASYDGFVPNTVGGVLTQAQFDALESRIYHYRDLPSLGLFFFGAVPADINDEDVYNTFASFSGPNGQFRITILGLPRLPGSPAATVAPTTLAQVTSPEFLANIAPAAGGNDNNGQPQTSGNAGNPDDLADIEPDAGNSDAACWSQAMDQASTGATVSYSFGATMEDALNQTAACGTAL